MRPRQRFIAAALLIAMATAPLDFAPAAWAGVDPEANTDTFDPVTESYGLNEGRRRSRIARQLEMMYQMQWYSGLGPQCPYPFELWPRSAGRYLRVSALSTDPAADRPRIATDRTESLDLPPDLSRHATRCVRNRARRQCEASAASQRRWSRSRRAPRASDPSAPRRNAAPKNAVPKRRAAAAELPAPAVEQPAPSDAQPGDFVPPTTRLERRAKTGRAF